MATRQPTDSAVLKTIVEGVQSDVAEIKGTMKEMVNALSKLTTVESRQADQTERIADAFAAIHKVSDRVATIEVYMPGLKEMRKWVVGGMVAGVAMMLIAVGNLVLNQKQPQIVLTSSPPAATTTTTTTQ